MTSESDRAPADHSRRALVHYGSTIGLVMRHGANLVVAVVMLAVPHSGAQPLGRVLLAILGAWAAYRLTNRSLSAVFATIDYTLTLAVCLAVPVLVVGADFHRGNCAPVAIAGTAVIGFAVCLPAKASLPATVGIAATFAYGSAQVVGWSSVAEIFNLYYFGLQWFVAALVRLMVIRVASAVDGARGLRQAAEVSERVTTAVREHDREQLRLIHDTVASTLLVIGQDDVIEPDRLARQARRDLALLDRQPAAEEPLDLDLVESLRDAAQYVRTPPTWTGAESLRVDGRTGRQVVAAAREALTNVDRHAEATAVTIHVSPGRVTITDNGVGFDPAAASSGTGVPQSITARLERIGGCADIRSSPGDHTVVELRWPRSGSDSPADAGVDPDRLIERTRLWYTLAIAGYAVANVVASASVAIAHLDDPTVQLVLACLAAAATLSAIPAVLGRGTALTWPSLVTLLGIGIIQAAAVPAGTLGSQIQWAQGAIGWCLMPHLLRWPVRSGAAMLTLSWALAAMVEIGRSPSSFTILNVGLGTASILSVQVFALLFSGLIRTGAEEARSDLTRQLESVARERITDALRLEHHRRYAEIIESVLPTLRALATGGAVDDATRRSARTESQRLRALFDQSATYDHPLVEEIQCAVDDAARRGVETSLSVVGDLPALSRDDARRLTGPVMELLAAHPISARCTVTGTGGGVTVSVACHGAHPAPLVATDLDCELTRTGDSTWLTVRYAAADPARR